MRHHIDIERKRPATWPWLLGLVVLGFVVYGVTSLLAAADEEDMRVAVPTAADTLPPAAIPTPPNPVVLDRVRSVEELAPLGTEHVGEVIRVEGEVLATGTTGFWILAGLDVLRVDSNRTVRKGEVVTVEGTIEPAAEERTEEIAVEVLSRTPRAEDWGVVESVKLVDSDGEAGPPESTPGGA